MWKLAAGVALAAGILVGWAALSVAHLAPRPVRSAFDHTIMFLGAPDEKTRCFDRTTVNGVATLDFIGNRQCYRFSNPRMFRGIYFDQFEGQVFIEGANPALRYRAVKPIWLSFDEQSDVSRSPTLIRTRNDESRIWQLEFVGRSTLSPGNYGHMGLSDGMVLVDRVTSAKPLTTFKGYVPDDVLQW